ncbi:unnamed protein product [Hymenolepis diminuta]|uniref:Uncharacterized protein n=1 Tax=Hymenolepis diminuta TaxID=6216 RepID=A0A564YD54_HYMDI|nr:unnamed protein product [Hymenolepis diminuta]
MSPDVSRTFNATVSLNSSKNSTQSPIVPVSPKVLRAVPSVKATTNDRNFHPSVRDNVKITNLMHSMKSSVITTPFVGVQIRVRHRKSSRSQYVVLTFKPKMNLTEIYLDTCDLPPPWNPETPEARRNHQPDHYCGRFGRHRKISRWIKRSNVRINNFGREALNKMNNFCPKIKSTI